MKKLMLLIVMILLGSALMSMTPHSRHFLSSETTGMYIEGIGYVLPEVHVIAYVNPQDSIRNQNREKLRKENHGKTVSETAQETPSGPGKGEVVSDVARQRGIQQQDRDRMHKPSNFGKPMHHARPMHPPKPITPPKGGKR